MLPPAPGRYAGTLRIQAEGGCSESWAWVDARASVVLDLDPHGGATGCRGLDYKHEIGAQGEDTGERHDRLEQQGLRGTWRADGEWLALDLSPDDRICSPVRTMSPGSGAEEKPPAWHLRCLIIDPIAAAELPGRTLLCRFETPLYVDEVGYTTTVSSVPGDWIVLGPGPGIDVKVTEWALYQRDTTYTAAAAPIVFDSWTRLL